MVLLFILQAGYDRDADAGPGGGTLGLQLLQRQPTPHLGWTGPLETQTQI